MLICVEQDHVNGGSRISSFRLLYQAAIAGRDVAGATCVSQVKAFTHGMNRAQIGQSGVLSTLRLPLSPIAL